jgi:hypothetical protein
MNGKSQNERIIFGFKIRQLRQEKGLSFANFAERTGMSISYLNEIEKGKKFPKEDKIGVIAKTLDVPAEELLSAELPRVLYPVEELLQSNFLNELPLDFFGIEMAKVVEMIASAPSQVGAFVSTLVELSRKYSVGEENFYFSALRSFLEINNNYFEDLEQAVDNFCIQNKLPAQLPVSTEVLEKILRKKYGYDIKKGELDKVAELRHFRSIFLPGKKKLLTSKSLSNGQLAFQLGKELGFNFLKLKERALTSSLVRAKSFEETLNHFKAGYFSAALLMPREAFLSDLQSFFSSPKWEGEQVIMLLRKYDASPEMFFQRMTNLLPQFFGLQNIFFIRLMHEPATGQLKIDKEIHLNSRHRQQGAGQYEHYCRRWLSFTLLNDLAQLQGAGKFAGTIVGAQLSQVLDTDEQYCCITIARPAYPTQGSNGSATLGIRLTPEAAQKITFLNDPSISKTMVNNTCERCPIADCKERAAPPKVLEEKERWRNIAKTLKKLEEE